MNLASFQTLFSHDKKTWLKGQLFSNNLITNVYPKK